MAPVISTVDVVLLTLKSDQLHVALLRRNKEPYNNQLALLGGYIHVNEDRDVEDAAVRVLREKAGVESPYLEQLGTYSGPNRDPRGWSLSVAHYALVPEHILLQSNTPDLVLVPYEGLKGLPFDHSDMVHAAVDRMRTKSRYSSMPALLMSETFTIGQLYRLYLSLGVRSMPDRTSFYRKAEKFDFLEPVGGVEVTKEHRPGILYRLKAEYRKSPLLLDRGFTTSI